MQNPGGPWVTRLCTKEQPSVGSHSSIIEAEGGGGLGKRPKCNSYMMGWDPQAIIAEFGEGP